MSRWPALAAALALALPLALPLAPAAAQETDVPLPMAGAVNFVMPTAAVPLGGVTWDGTGYRLDDRVFHSQDAALGWYPTELSLGVPGAADAAVRVRLLINLDGSADDFDGQKVGEVVLRWGNGAQQTVNLIAGRNVRGWLVSDTSGPLRDAGTTEVYRGQDVYGRTAVIDALTVTADPSVAASGLARVIVRDTSFDTANALDPALVVRAVTIQTE